MSRWTKASLEVLMMARIWSEQKMISSIITFEHHAAQVLSDTWCRTLFIDGTYHKAKSYCTNLETDTFAISWVGKLYQPFP